MKKLMIMLAMACILFEASAWPFGSNVPDEILAMARASCSGKFTAENCEHFVNKAGKTYVEPRRVLTISQKGGAKLCP